MGYSKDAFILKARKVHGDKYDYSKVDYVGSHMKVCIICPEHGEFWQTPSSHLSGRGCKKCGYIKNGNNNRTKFEDFVNKANIIHKFKYDYSKVDYVDNKTKVCIICPEHGEFWQTPNNHLNNHGCPYCFGNKKMNNKEFITKANMVHNFKYDYSKVNYVNNKTLVEIICPEHGSFLQSPDVHLRGFGCPSCSGNKRLNNEDFIERSMIIHNNFYDYSKVDIKNSRQKVCIICPIHGEFLQNPSHHLQGCGCPKCNKSKLEIEIEKNFPQLEQQKSFEWLKNKSEMFLDFYDEETNVAIECQGEQHFYINPTSRFGRFGKFESIRYRDKLKYQQCKEHNIEIIYYFPKDYLKYDVDFYKDKLCFHTIDDLKTFFDNLKS